MSDAGKTVIALHGDDEYSICQVSAQKISEVGAEDPSGMNIVQLDSRLVNEEDLRTALNTLPFLSSRRLVVLSNLPPRQDGQRFTALLEQMPATTLLVVQLFDVFERNHWKQYDMEKHWLAQWIKLHPDQAEWHEHRLPSPFAMPGWLQKQAKSMEGKITPAAADRLAEWIGTDTRLAVKELEKLLTYGKLRACH